MDRLPPKKNVHAVDNDIKTPKRKRETPTVPNGTPTKRPFQPPPFEDTRSPTQESQSQTLSTSKRPHPYEGLPRDVKHRIVSKLIESPASFWLQILDRKDMDMYFILTQQTRTIKTRIKATSFEGKIPKYMFIFPIQTAREVLKVPLKAPKTTLDSLELEKRCKKSNAFAEALLDGLLNNPHQFQTDPSFTKQILINVLKNTNLCKENDTHLSQLLEKIIDLEKKLRCDYLPIIFQHLIQQPINECEALFKAILKSKASLPYIFTPIR